MEPLFFESNKKQIFGIYHTPHGNVDRNTGVVLCYPFGQEYIRSHRSFLQLSVMLANEGFHVLRFDYFGTGDSMGESTDFSLLQSQKDIAEAINELKFGSEVSSISLIGYRLGANMALKAGYNNQYIRNIVLWDPVFNPAEYLQKMQESYMKWLHGSFYKNKNHSNGEIHGFPLTDKLKEEIKNMEIKDLFIHTTKNILYIGSFQVKNQIEELNQLKKAGLNIDIEESMEKSFWLSGDDINSKGIVPSNTLTKIVKWSCKTTV